MNQFFWFNEHIRNIKIYKKGNENRTPTLSLIKGHLGFKGCATESPELFHNSSKLPNNDLIRSNK